MERKQILSLVREYGTPLYVYDGQKLIKQCRLLRSSLPDYIEVLYSIKANPSMGICTIVRQQGLGAEIASGGELCIALDTGFPASKIVAAGPAKTVEELEHYISSGIWIINCESRNELSRIDDIAKSKGKRVKIALRINPKKIGGGAKVKMGGKSSQFGIDEELIDETLCVVEKLEHVSLVGIHIYCGTQILNAQTIVDNCRYISSLAKDIVVKTKNPLEVVNFGGGLGIPYTDKEKDLDITTVCNGIKNICEDLRNSSDFRDTRFVLETGRFLVGPAGFYLCTIQDIKVSRGTKYLILDGGINNYMAASPLFRFDFHNPIIRLIKRVECEPAKAGTFDIVGPLCTTIDFLARKAELPEPEIGDPVMFCNAGAYALTLSPVMFLVRPMPAEVMISGKKIILMRERGSYEQPIRINSVFIDKEVFLHD